MKTDNKLKVGDMAITLGYYEANDGGGAEYKIVSGNHTDDGGSYHELINGSFAELIRNNENNVNQFGAYGDGIHDDTVFIQNYFNFCKFGDIIHFVNGCTYYITAKTYIKNECSIDFNWCTILVDGNLNDYAIYWGYDSSYSRVGWNRLRCYAHNFYARTNDDTFHPGTHFLKVGRESVIEHFDSRYIDTVIAWDSDYIDFTVIKYGYISSRGTSDNFAIDIGSQGDLLEISHIQQGGTSTERGDDKTIRVQAAHYNALIKDIIGSIETQTDCIIENIMLSFDFVIKCYGHHCTLRHIRGTLNKYPEPRIMFYRSDYSSPPHNNPNIILEDVSFYYADTEVTYENPLTTLNYPIYIDYFDTLCLKDVFVGTRRVKSNTTNEISFAYIKFRNIDPYIEIERWINSYISYYNGVTITPQNYKQNFTIVRPDRRGGVDFEYSYGSSSVIYNGESGTYIYELQRIFDLPYKIFGEKSSQTASIMLTKGGNSGLLKITGSQHWGQYILRRKQDSDSDWTSYCILNILNNCLIDNGVAVNGIPWIIGTLDTTKAGSGNDLTIIHEGNKISFKGWENKNIIDTAILSGGDTYLRYRPDYEEFSFWNGTEWISVMFITPSSI